MACLPNLANGRATSASRVNVGVYDWEAFANAQIETEMIERSFCPSCDEASTNTVHASADYTLRRCTKCDLVFADPMLGGDSSYYQAHLVYANRTALDIQHERAHLDSRRCACMLELTKGGARTLDIGCGCGAFVAFARDEGRESYGIDFNDQHIRLGKTVFNLKDSLMIGDILSMPQEWSEFDLVTMFEVIEHLPNPEEVISQVYRRLRKGGYLAISCPNEARWQPMGRIFVDYPPHHLTRWTPDCLRGFLERNSFEHVRTEIDASLRDVLWTAYANRRARRKSTAPSPTNAATRLRDCKWALDGILRKLCLPFDAILRGAHVGTMGMRVVVRKV